jgi:predicted amidophosphoribosyltransferase
MPMRPFQYPCIGEGDWHGDTINRPFFPARYRRFAASPSRMAGSKRIRATPQQVGRSRTERADNIQGAFLIPPDHKVEVAGRRLVLVDDVLTSGATVDACTRALLRAGAPEVDELVFARVVAPARSPI